MKHYNGKSKPEMRTKKFIVALVSAFVAVALGITCALCFGNTATRVSVDDVQSGEVTTSARARGALTGNQSGTNALAENDYMDYTGVTAYNITLPKGTFKFEVWGAQGGDGYQNGTLGAGSQGGYSVGTVTLTSSRTFYIVVGGKGGTGRLGTYGNNSYGAGGYNGGGRSGCEMNSDANDEGGGGGGATHIALESGLLSSFNSKRSKVVIVAGGGGGTSYSRNTSYGKGGGLNGGAGYSGSPAAGGGSQTAGGTAGRTAESGATHGTAGGFGQGGVGGNGTTGGGGGGGGWFGGGAGGAGGQGGSGGGGSGYIGTASGVTPEVKLTGANSTAGGRSGNGMARITVVKLNDAPVTLNANGTTPSSITSNLAYKGVSRNLQIRADAIARDPDPVNTSAGSTGTKNVYFTQNASNRDTPPATNNHLYLNAACTQLATNYLSWTWTNTTLTITEIKRLPRNGVDGCTSNGRLTLYTRVRDNFGTTSTRGVSVIPFYLTINDNGIKNSDSAYQRFTKSGYEYRYGNKNLSSGGTTYDFAKNTSTIYNPANNNKTLFISTPLTPTDKNGFTVYASDIYSDADTHATYGDLVAIKSVTALSGYTNYSNYYTITYDTTSASAYASGLVPSFTIKPTGVRPNGPIFVCATITAQSSERQSKVAIGSQNTSVTLVFQIANTRPYFASTAGKTTSFAEPYIELTPNQSTTINVSKIVFDTDDTNLTATFARGATDLKIPTNEYIQVNRANAAVPLLQTAGGRSSNYYNKTSVATDSSTSGEGTTPTGFNKDLIASSGSAAASTANVIYSYDNTTTLRLTARASTQYQYSQEGRIGDFYIMVRLVDPTDTTDNGLWYPIAIKVTSAAPKEPTTVANFSLNFETYQGGDASKDADQGDRESGVVLTPISYTDANGTLRGIGTTDSSFMGANATHALPFVTDADTFMYAGDGVEQTRALNDLVVLNGSSLSSIVKLYDTSAFFEVELVSLYAARTVFDRLELTEEQLSSRLGVRTYNTGDGSSYGYTFYGLRIKPLRSTNDLYFQFEVNVKDSHGTPSLVRVCVNVRNRELSVRRDPKSTSSYKINPMTGVGVYENNRNINAYAVNYSIERNDVIQITPYDFAYDFDVDPKNSNVLNNPTLNTNPVDDGFADAVEYIRKEYKVPYTTSPNSPAAIGDVKPVMGQQLAFSNTANFLANAAQYSAYIDASVEDKCSVKTVTDGVVNTVEYSVPCIKITGLSRTTSAVVQLRFNISDGYSSVEVIVTVTVLNSAPMLNTIENHPKESDDDKRVSEPYNMSADVNSGYNAYQFTVDHAAYDKDGDTTLSFVAGSVRIVAYDENGKEQFDENSKRNYYYDALDKDFRGVSSTDSDAVYILSDYVYSALTKNSVGEDVVYIRALSSTELFDKPIYLEFKVDDGFRAQPQRSVLHILINVQNSKVKFESENLTAINETDYSWLISYDDISETRLSRYIVNSKELYDSSAINVSAANKIWLFDDADAQQHAMLNPQSFTQVNGNYATPLIYKNSSTTETTITESMFTTQGGSGYNAAIIYTPTYRNEQQADNQFLELKLHFYAKSDTGFTELLTTLDEKTVMSPYWAIEIIDKVNKTEAARTQIAIAVKDDHHKSTLYSADKKSTFDGDSSITVLNLYYEYQMPGITAMHTYYRTDAYTESRTLIDPSDASKGYVLDINTIESSRTDLFAKGQNVPTTQTGLQDARFANNFEYFYFVKKVVRNNGADITPKYFPSKPFAYKPIEVGGSTTASVIEMPISYMAMPQTVTGSTEGNSVHVTFANATMSSQVGADQLSDSDYLNWGNTQKNLDLVFENVTLTDGTATGSWSGSTLNDNPYIKISYKADPKYIGTADVDGATRNIHRNTLGNQGEDGGGMLGLKELTAFDANGNSLYREDKYGFTFEKKTGNNAVRAPGPLKLTVALKTTSIVDGNLKETSPELVDVDIILHNSKPTVKYGDNLNGYVDNINIDMTTADVNGKTVALYNSKDQNNSDIVKADIKLFYTDPDTTDTMKFLLSSANGTMTRAETDYITNSTNSSGAAKDTALRTYFNGVAGDDRYGYNPNPNYEKFFKVSPNEGAASTLQFVPVAKTQLNLPKDSQERADYISDNNLAEDSRGIYYPYRILFYDDLNGSAFTEGTWTSALIKVYIKNDEISVDKNVVDKTYGTSGTYYGLPTYEFKLSTGADFFVNVTTLLKDNDIVLDEATSSFATETDTAWTTLSAEQKYIYDYLVMPDPQGTVIKRPGRSSDPLPVAISLPTSGQNMSKSTLVFRATSAFKGKVDIVYTFKDSVDDVAGSGGSSVSVVFSILYNNEKPTANVDTYSGADAINIVMKKGDTFTLYAADSTLFQNDVYGGFDSYHNGNNPVAILNGVTFPYNETEQSAKQMYDSFKFYSESSYPDKAVGYLGALVVGSDDAASTLRFDRYSAEDCLSNRDDRNYITVTPGRQFAREDNKNVSRPMSVTIRAEGVVNTVYKLTLRDGEGDTTEVSVNITVLSTEPTIKTTDLPKGLALSTDSSKKNTFTAEMTYGSELEFVLRDFMQDDDLNDEARFAVSRNADNSYFTVVNPEGVTAVSASVSTMWGDNSVLIKAEDVIADKDGIATVSFRVKDEHGKVSDVITIEITIKPSQVKAIATSDKAYSLTLKSFADYVKDGQPVVVDLVSDTNAVIFEDADVGALSAKYNVTIYALLAKNTDGSFSSVPLSALDRREGKLFELTESDSGDTDTEISEYVKKFFGIEVSDDGKQLILTPNSATIANSGVKLADIRLYIELSKRYKNGSNTTLDTQSAYVYVSVANSALMAVESSPINSGYPEITVGENETRLRDEGFLEFTGTAGDSLTWDLFNVVDREFGLFYDYDMINNYSVTASRNSLETINYVRSSYTVSENLQSISGKGDVLSVTVSENGKLTIKINRKVFRGSNTNGWDTSYTDIDVVIYCADTLGYRPDNKVCASTTIKVRVENDIPEIKTVTDVEVIERLGYSVTYSDVEGYVLEAKLEKDAVLTVNVPDIIEDADIDMDSYVMLYTGGDQSLMASDGYLTGSTTTAGANDGIGRIRRGSETLLSVRLFETNNSYNITTLRRITFTCESATRGAVATCEIQFRDSVKTAKTHVLTVRITVDNVAPTVRPDVSTALTVMGVGFNADSTEIGEAVKTFSILDFVTDINGDNFDANDNANNSKNPTYVFIDEIIVYSTEDVINKPSIYGPGTELDITDENYTPVVTACSVGWDSADEKHQTFAITPAAGVYGVQTVTLRVIDSGYEDGLAAGILDGKSYDLTLTITIANPLNDVADVLPTKNIAYGITRTVTVTDLLGEQNAQGYIISSIEETGSNSLTVYAPGESAGVQTSATAAQASDEWRIYAKTEGAKVNLTVTFKAGEIVRVRTLPVAVVANTAPTYIGGKTSYEYTVSRLDDSHKRTLKIYPEDWFEDVDEEDIMSFVGPVTSSQSVKVNVLFDYDDVADGGRAFILLTFNRRGASDLTFNVSDLSGRLYERKVTVNCTDAPELSWWENFVSLIEANWMWFWIIVACILLFIILLIILIVVIHKKRKMRREIEALLNSETELEEEMLRLSAGGGMAPYQSFGYLPPTQTTVNNPNLMIGGSVNNPTPNSLQLNAGTGSAPVGGQQQQVAPPASGAPQNAMPQQGNGAPVNAAPQQPPQQNAPVTPPVSDDGFNPDDF